MTWLTTGQGIRWPADIVHVCTSKPVTIKTCKALPRLETPMFSISGLRIQSSYNLGFPSNEHLRLSN